MADFLPSRSVLSVFFPNCLLTSGEVEQLRKSKEIDKCINRDKTYVKRLVKILLLGAGESGKSTFLKQMRIIHGQDFDQKAKEEFRATIFSNVIKGKTTPSTQYETCRSCRDFGVCIALLLHGRVWCGKFVAMLAAAEPIGLHFSVLDNASGSATKKRPCYFCFVCTVGLKEAVCMHFLCSSRSLHIYFFPYYLLLSQTYCTRWFDIVQVFSSWLLLALKHVSRSCMQATWHRNPLKNATVYCKHAYH